MTKSKNRSQSYENVRIVAGPDINAWDGQVRWSASKSIWITGMSLAGLSGVATSTNWETVSVFLISTAITLCLGHSLGMHRRFIHNSYACPKWLEYLFVYFGVLVGLAGPFGMMFTHDIRDWAQRQRRCHPYFGHKTSFWRDGFWQMHCDLVLASPPEFKPEEEVANDRFYKFLERTWMWQQLPLAIVLFMFGGIEWVLWGTCLRVAVSVTGHWLIGHFAHNTGQRNWHVEGAAVQGFNIRFCGLITMGECWHNNHHAYPGSAKLGLSATQADPGWWVLMLLEKTGLVWQINTPADLPYRPELVEISNDKKRQPFLFKYLVSEK